MKFVVLRPFTWAGKGLKKGDAVELVERNPRTSGLLQGHFITYDPSSRPSGNIDET